MQPYCSCACTHAVCALVCISVHSLTMSTPSQTGFSSGGWMFLWQWHLIWNSIHVSIVGGDICYELRLIAWQVCFCILGGKEVLMSTSKNMVAMQATCFSKWSHVLLFWTTTFFLSPFFLVCNRHLFLWSYIVLEDLENVCPFAF